MSVAQIREIQIQDNQQIAAAIREVFISDNFPKTGTAFEDPQLDFMFQTYNKDKSVYFVIEENEKIVGGAGISQLENATSMLCELQKMYLLTGSRGKGLGQQLIKKCLKKASEFGYTHCYLETLREMVIAQHLYKKMGFEYLENPIGNTGHTSCPVWMIKELTSNF